MICLTPLAYVGSRGATTIGITGVVEGVVDAGVCAVVTGQEVGTVDAPIVDVVVLPLAACR